MHVAQLAQHVFSLTHVFLFSLNVLTVVGHVGDRFLTWLRWSGDFRGRDGVRKTPAQRDKRSPDEIGATIVGDD